MNIVNTRDEFGLISKLLHWLIALIMIALISIGWYMTGLSDQDILYWRLLDLHEFAGLLLFVLVPLKFVWRPFSPNPPYVPGLKSWERRTAQAVRVFFLTAMVLIPLSGFLFVASNGEAVELYGFITIPDIGQFSDANRKLLSNIHYYLSYVCAALIVLHILAALKHHFIDGNRTLRRMTF